jgi:hypothetical protein
MQVLLAYKSDDSMGLGGIYHNMCMVLVLVLVLVLFLVLVLVLVLVFPSEAA